MRKVIYFIFLILLVKNAFPQSVETQMRAEIPFKMERFIGVDNFNNLYGINEQVFYKISPSKTQEFQALQLGEITSADIINPLKITLFYKNTNTVVILDNNLNEIDRINFSQIQNFRNLASATTGKNRSLWIYNIDLQRLELFDYYRERVLAHSQPLGENVLNHKSNFNFCWILSKQNIKVYNTYGSLVGTLPNNGYKKISENNNRLAAVNEQGEIALFLEEKKQFIPLSISQNAVKDFYLQNDYLYIYSGKIIYQYQLTLPK